MRDILGCSAHLLEPSHNIACQISDSIQSFCHLHMVLAWMSVRKECAMLLCLPPHVFE